MSPEKSGIVNLKKSYSEFLGFRIKVVKRVNGHKTKYVVRSHIKNRSLEKISKDVKRLIHKIEFSSHGKCLEHAAVTRYNSYVLGVYNYYTMATMVSRDLRKLAFLVQKSLKSRL